MNAVDDAGRSTLHILARKCRDRNTDMKYLTCIMVMVRAEGIVLDKKDKSSESTPLELAVNETGNWDVVKVLAEAGADVTGTRSDIVRVFGEPAYKKLMTCDFDDTMLLGNANAALRYTKTQGRSSKTRFYKLPAASRAGSKIEFLLKVN